MNKDKHINILGTRGIPGAHGGFETFATHLAPYLRDRGYIVSVYCQNDSDEGPQIQEDEWCGIHRVHIRPKYKGVFGTMEFDFRCVKHVLKRPGIDLVLGYNTAVFNILERMRGRRVVMNMDGIEWMRAKWGLPARLWFFLNEIIGVNMCSAAIADHPEMVRHLKRRSFKEPIMIPYGAARVLSAPVETVLAGGLVPDNYFISIARIEPENSILELVRAFSRLKTTAKFVVLGKLLPGNSYHDQVKSAAASNVVFLGAVYEPEKVAALRFYARAYLHGHQVGGTNPSLVEALGAGNAVIAHDNRFNRWVAGSSQFYFTDELSACSQMSLALADDNLIGIARRSARIRHSEAFEWAKILQAYERALFEVTYPNWHS